MKASKMIKELQQIISLHGDLQIVGGYLMDDTPLKKVTVIRSDGCEIDDGRGEATGIFLES